MCAVGVVPLYAVTLPVDPPVSPALPGCARPTEPVQRRAERPRNGAKHHELADPKIPFYDCCELPGTGYAALLRENTVRQAAETKICGNGPT